MAERLEASLRRAMRAFESGDLRRAGAMIAAERRRAASTGDDEAVEIIDTWVPQLRAVLVDDRELGTFDAGLASREARGVGAREPPTPEPEATGGGRAGANLVSDDGGAVEGRPGPRAGSHPPDDEPRASRSMGDATALDAAWIRIGIRLYVLGQLVIFLGAALAFLRPQILDHARLPTAPTGSFAYIAGSIFLHNARIVLLEILPLLGVIVFLPIGLLTGIDSGHILSHRGGLPAALVAVASPILWLEPVAYALAATESFYLIRAFLAKRFGLELRRAAVVLGMSLAVLFFSALLESTPIYLLQYNRVGAAVSYFLIWIPVAFVFAAAYRWCEHHSPVTIEALRSWRARARKYG
jgi:hypothetical protein